MIHLYFYESGRLLDQILSLESPSIGDRIQIGALTGRVTDKFIRYKYDGCGTVMHVDIYVKEIE